MRFPVSLLKRTGGFFALAQGGGFSKPCAGAEYRSFIVAVSVGGGVVFLPDADPLEFSLSQIALSFGDGWGCLRVTEACEIRDACLEQ